MNWAATMTRLSGNLLTLSFCLILAICQECQAQGKDGGEFDGAVWGFKLTPKIKGLSVMGGQYRVQGAGLYQRETREDKFTKVVGKKLPTRKDDQSKVEFTQLRARSEDGSLLILKGTAMLKFERYGEWGGAFIDSEGRHWDFHCSRQKE